MFLLFLIYRRVLKEQLVKEDLEACRFVMLHMYTYIK